MNENALNEISTEIEDIAEETLENPDVADISDASAQEEKDIHEDNDETEVSESPMQSEPEDEKSELEALRSELTKLKEELEEKKSSLERLGKELSEFSELFPEASVNALPDAVWESVRNGVPLAAAYALYQKKSELRLKKAGEVNERNNVMSTGSLGKDTTESFFTPNEVRAMSRSEIRKNYSKILESMKKWN